MPRPAHIHTAHLIVITVVALGLATSPANRAFADDRGILRPIIGELPASLQAATLPFLVGDRFEYQADDENAEFLALLTRHDQDASGTALRIDLINCTDGRTAQAVSDLTIRNVGRSAFEIDISKLPAGTYVTRASQVDNAGEAMGTAAEFRFVKSDKLVVRSPFPESGIPLTLEPQNHLPEATWPVRCGVPMPQGLLNDVSRLALFEDGKRVPAQFTPRATWARGGSIQWVHVDFLSRYRGGRASSYRLHLLASVPTQIPTQLKAAQSDDSIVVETGALRFSVDRRRFSGIANAWVAPHGDGNYDLQHPLVARSPGPYIIDGRLIRFEAAADKNVRVEIEEQGPVRVTIVASGWYTNTEGRVDPLAMFKTRITAFAGQSLVRISHHTTLTYDTRHFRLADVDFGIGLVDATTFSVGIDGKSIAGDLPPTPDTISVHQFRYDHLRILDGNKRPTAGKISNGWFIANGNTELKQSVDVYLRDVWQKFPKEVELSRNGIDIHFWPKHGVRAFTLADELDIKNIYKFWCFHQNSLLDLNLPDAYYDRLVNDYKSETTECRPEHALNGNGQGLVIGNEFALDFHTARKTNNVAQLAELYQLDPTALPDPGWNASTSALGAMGAIDQGHFAALEEAMQEGFLSETRNIERGHEYGMWNYADMHTYWHVDENRADLHRVWRNSHYHEVGTAWLMLFRSGSARMLHWARKASDHYMNIDTINYADTTHPLKFHIAGAMYHCKGLTHWGSEAYGMERRDSHAGLFGHWVDPDALLWCWYIDGNARAKDVYDMWSESIRKHGLPTKGTRREANTSLAVALTYYRSSWDPSVLPAIHGLGYSLRTAEPLEQQVPGPLWHPLWINRYYEFTRDPEYASLILKYGRQTQISDTWTLALSALAFDISGDSSYLTQHFDKLTDFPQRFFRAPGDPYDWFGVSPGADGCHWGYMSWPFMVAALQKAGITQIEPRGELTAQLPLSRGRPKHPSTPPSAIVLAMKTADRPFEVRLHAKSLAGDMHDVELMVFSPTGKLLRTLDLPHGPRGYDGTETIAEKDQLGIYRFEFRTHEAAIDMPLTDLSAEAVMWPKGQIARCRRWMGFILPLKQRSPVELQIEPDSDRTPCNFRLTDAMGKVLSEGSLFRPRKTPAAKIILASDQKQSPWKLEIVGPAAVSWRGDSGPLLWARSLDDIRAIAKVAARDPNRLIPQGE